MNTESENKSSNLLIGCTGSIASKLLLEIIKASRLLNFNIKIVLTNSAKIFTDKEELDYTHLKNSYNCDIFTDNDEWQYYNKFKRVLHIELRDWANYLLIAPLSANTLAKIYNGICDNLLTCIIKAWCNNKQIFYAPAMNTKMYNHYLTEIHRNYLNKVLGYIEIVSESKRLACGDIGIGAMAHINKIFKEINNYVNRKKITDYFKKVPLAKKKD